MRRTLALSLSQRERGLKHFLRREWARSLHSLSLGERSGVRGRTVMQIRFYATLRPLVGGRGVDLSDPPDTIKGILERLASEYVGLHDQLFDEDGTVRRFVAIMVDGRDIRHIDGLDSRVNPESELDIFPPVAGG